MRLSKRITACALAAVMSVSLMVGCAGSGTKPNPGSSSSTSSSTSTKPDSGSNSNSSASSGSNANSNSSSNSNSNSSSSDATAEPTWAKSKSYKYGLLLNGEKVELKTHWSVRDLWYQTETETDSYYTKNGNKSYYKMVTPESGEGEILLLDNRVYLIIPEYKTCDGISMETFTTGEFKVVGNKCLMVGYLKDIIGTTKPTDFAVGKRKATGETVYDTETFTRTIDSAGKKVTGQVTCFYTDDTLKWVEFVSGNDRNHHRAWVRVDQISATSNDNLIRIPDGYEVNEHN